ncbi:hypothetical protein EZV62_000470 [Acer yangbiense]|uniref:Uncharacterized protein n=1 Tax=Acer yangbiense TaxID=1000413 RepID=A0A5C7IRG0_9ROSI|nr:hypothetical protein EZV62_000470 [Acer yangbiense]
MFLRVVGIMKLKIGSGKDEARKALEAMNGRRLSFSFSLLVDLVVLLDNVNGGLVALLISRTYVNLFSYFAQIVRGRLIFVEVASTGSPENGDRNNRREYHERAVKLQSAAVKGNKKEIGKFLRDDPLKIRWAITRGHKTLLHVATGAKQTALVKMIMEHMHPDDLMLQDRNGNTAFCFAAAVGATEIAEMMLVKKGSLATFRGSQNKTPLYMVVLFGQKKMAEKLYTKTLPHLKPPEEIAIFFKSIDTGLYGKEPGLVS